MSFFSDFVVARARKDSVFKEKLYRGLYRNDFTYKNQYPSIYNTLSKGADKDDRQAFREYWNYIQIDADRKRSYDDYEMMDDDVIGSALDLWAEDATQFDLEDGTTFHVECSNPTVKNIVEKLFENISIEEHLFDIARNFAKYGDNFVRVKGDFGKGISSLDYSYHPKRVARLDKDGLIQRFIVDGKKDYNPWDFVHFRMPGGDSFYKEGQDFSEEEQREDFKTIYGKSALDKARKPWRQLSLLEDSLVMSKLSRAIKRNVFSVNVGNLGETAAWDLVDKVSALIKKKRSFNTSSSQMNSRSSLLDVDEDIVLPVSGEKGSVAVQEIGGDTDVKNIADVDYYNNKLFAALKVPKAYLGFEEALNGRNTLRMLDVRYARTVKNIQRVLMLGLLRIARIHLAYLGYDPFDFDLKIIFNYISTIEESEKMETLSSKVGAITSVLSVVDMINKDNNLVDNKELLRTTLKRLDYSEEEIKRIILNTPVEKEEGNETGEVF